MEALISRMISERYAREEVDKLSYSMNCFRESILSSDENWQLTIEYCKNDIFMARVLASCDFCPLICIFILSFFVSFNRHDMPWDCYIFFLPIDSFMSVNWIINYLVQVAMGGTAVVFYYFYNGYKFLLINYSCWEIEAYGLQVKKLFKNGKPDGHEAQVKAAVERSYRVLEWLDQVRGILRIAFFVDFTLSSIIACMCLYTLSSDPFGSIIVFVVCFYVLSQLAIDCWMGSRVDDRIEQLAADVYDISWYSVDTKYHKDVILLLNMVQCMKGFNGIFQAVNLETLQRV